MKFLSLLAVVLVISMAFASVEIGIYGGCGCDQHGWRCEFPRDVCIAKGIPVFGETYQFDGRYKNNEKMKVDNELKTRKYHANNGGKK